MSRHTVSVDPAVLTAIIDDIQQAIDHNRSWGGEMRLHNAAQRTQEQLADILSNAATKPRKR